MLTVTTFTELTAITTYHNHTGQQSQRQRPTMILRLEASYLDPPLMDKITTFKPLTSEELPSPVWSWVKLHDGIYYHAQNIWEPQVGDYRVHFLCAGREGEVFTVVGKQVGQEIVPYHTEVGEELFILRTGLKEAGDVFLSEHHQNRT